ncbi:hypothetical protein Ancab_019611 [Ancistrocladus abbreviatus]
MARIDEDYFFINVNEEPDADAHYNWKPAIVSDSICGTTSCLNERSVVNGGNFQILEVEQPVAQGDREKATMETPPFATQL